ncbi:hypothetical protein GCM10012275_15400 [Longimycelium tulufanense]|uniref:Uncharacterized protein n=1 Tax=Longimycelium tulufanense TaxID=907463 RepID=A0A8J3CC08_9PSEU|nr:hypothetical protein GCM10012275_15400 [Longimycelium tulufanense]
MDSVTLTHVIYRDNWGEYGKPYPLDRYSRVFSPSDDAPGSWLVRWSCGNQFLVPVPDVWCRIMDEHGNHAVDANEYKRWFSQFMFGGCFVSSSDSRFSELIGGRGTSALRLHDRTER